VTGDCAMTKRILMTGNEAIAAGALQAGCRFYAGYPITPQNELIAYMAKYMPQAGGVFIQAESELAAINMVFGASAAGARAMTSSSSPGMSLKQEGISYIAGAELPAVIVNMMRGGPGLGNIAPSQSDYFQATRCGHGDYHSIVLAPATVHEAYYGMRDAFDLADKYRTPVIVLGDGMLGQMMEPLELTQAAAESSEYKKDWALSGCAGRPANVVKSFYLHEGKLEEFNLLLQKKYKRIKEKEQRAESILTDDAEIILVAYGSMARIAKTAVKTLRAQGVKAGLIRPISLWPFPEAVFKKLAAGRKKRSLLVVEMSYGQMIEDVRLSIGDRFPVEFLGRGGGGVPSEKEIIVKVKHLTGKKSHR